MTKDESRTKTGRGGRPNYRSGRQDSGRFPRKPENKKILNSSEAVPELTFGRNTNFYVFKPKLLQACLEKYGNLATFIKDKSYYIPESVNMAEYYLTKADRTPEDNPVLHKAYEASFLQAHKSSISESLKMKLDRPKIYAYIQSKLSVASEDEVKKHPEYARLLDELDPLGLWKAITERPT